MVQCCDEWAMSYNHSRDVLIGTIAPVNSQHYLHALVLHGQLFGHWRQVNTIEFSVYRPLNTRYRAALRRAIEAYGNFMGTTFETIESSLPV